jgi:hypothetical protein
MNIVSWNPVIYGNNTFPLPVLTVKGKPLSDKNITVQIFNTGSIYDGKVINGVYNECNKEPKVKEGEDKDEDKEMLITLFCGWMGYPPNTGTVKVIAPKVAEEIAVVDYKESEESLKTPLPFYANTQSGTFTPTIETYHTSSSTVALCIVLVILIIASLFIPL